VPTDEIGGLGVASGKSAVIYGAGGSIGGAVARAFAREGATVFLAGRTAAKLDAVADQIRSAGGVAKTTQLDALDEQAVDEHADAMAAATGSIDISFNLISQITCRGRRWPQWTLTITSGRS
jgi:3-oxoacyl-[acyl-carrier protein] reductase